MNDRETLRYTGTKGEHMGFWGTAIIASGCLALYTDLAVRLVEMLQRTGLISSGAFVNGYESVRIAALVVLVVCVVAYTILYYRKHHEFFWNDIINP